MAVCYKKKIFFFLSLLLRNINKAVCGVNLIIADISFKFKNRYFLSILTKSMKMENWYKFKRVCFGYSDNPNQINV